MANKRDLKKNLNYVFGDIIETAYLWEYENTDKDNKKSQEIVDESINAFDELIARVNQKNVDDVKAHFKAINQDLETKAKELIEKINKLG